MNTLNISCDFPGGNIILNEIKTENGITEVFVEQDLRDTERWWFYWSFKVINPPAGKVNFCFCNKGVVCPYGAAVSENGFDYAYDTAGYIDDTHFTYTFTGSEKEMYFAFTLPYVLSHFESFYREICGDSTVKRDILCKSEGGRSVPLLAFGSGEKAVLFTSRHHCCESTANFVLEGVIMSLLTEYRSLLGEFTFYAVPFIDLDGAQRGDQGKARKPHDHNLDYTAEPLYESVRAIKVLGDKIKPLYFIDFHSPWKWGGADSRPHIYVNSCKSDGATDETRFVDTVKAITEAPGFCGITYDGYTNYSGDYADGLNQPCADCWFKLRGARFSITIENPYSGDGVVYTPDLLRDWGSNITKAFNIMFGK